MAASPQDVKKNNTAAQMKTWESVVDAKLNDGQMNAILIQLMLQESDAEALAKLYRAQGWTVSYRSVGGRTPGYIFDFSS